MVPLGIHLGPLQGAKVRVKVWVRVKVKVKLRVKIEVRVRIDKFQADGEIIQKPHGFACLSGALSMNNIVRPCAP